MFRIFKFRSVIEAELFLNGGILGGNELVVRGVDNLVGQTLTFTSPVASVTFTPSLIPGRDDPERLTIADIAAQVKAVDPNIVTINIGGAVGFKHVSGTTPIALAAAPAPAKVILGFPGNTTVVGQVIGSMYTAPAIPPYLYWFQQADSAITVVVWE